MLIHSYDGKISDAERNMPLYVVTVGKSLPQRLIHRPAGINDYQLLYTLSGKGTVRIKEDEFEVSEGDVFILPPFTPHEYGPLEGEWNTLWITYNGTVAKSGFAFDADIRRGCDFELYHKRIIRGKAQEGRQKRASVSLYELLLCLSECEGISAPKSYSAVPDVSAAVQYISEHYHETVELSKLAELAGLSDGHFCRVFKAHTHMRPLEYVIHLKIERAKDMLIEKTPISISDIAKKLGYTSAAYFSKTFKEKVGMTPEEYRKTVLKL